MTKQAQFSEKQLVFKELFVGTLLYAVVLGFFNDYTSYVTATSFSTVFFAAFVLECLTYGAFLLKKKLVGYFQEKTGKRISVFTIFSVWFVLFISKFVFIWAVDVIFGDAINIIGFFGIVFIMLSVTIAHKLADLLFQKLK
jgi:hypothetical protein